MAKLARNSLAVIGKILLFVILFCIAARLINAESFISYETSSNFSEWLHGYSSQDNFDDLWFFTDFGLSLIAALAGSLIILRIARKLFHRQA